VARRDRCYTDEGETGGFTRSPHIPSPASAPVPVPPVIIAVVVVVVVAPVFSPTPGPGSSGKWARDSTLKT